MGANNFNFPCNSLTFLFSFLLCLLLFSNIQTTLAASQTTPTSCARKSSNKLYTNFIKKNCNSTIYPSLCYNSLSSYASKIKTNSQKLTNVALSITIKSARQCSSLLSTMAKSKGLRKTDKAVIKDCKEEIDDSVYEFQRSLDALNDLKKSSDKEFQMANIKTWVSAAITDEDTCIDELKEMKVSSSLKNKMKACVSNLAQMTSNSLALVDLMDY